MSDQLVLGIRSPLADMARPGRFGRPGPGVVLSEISGRGLVDVLAQRGRKSELAAVAQRTFGCELPRKPRLVEGRNVSFIWAGPARWLALFDSAGAGEAQLIAFAGLAALVDQSDGRALVRVRGPQARAALAKGLPIDLDEHAFGPGDVALSVAAQIPVHLWQVDAAPTYEIAVPRSFALSFWHWVTASAAEFGYEVTAEGE